MTDKPSFSVSQELEVVHFKQDKAYTIPCREWNVLKEQIENATGEPWFFRMVGSLLWGAAIAVSVSIWTKAFGPPDEQDTAYVIAWAVCAVCAICGSLCLLFAHKETAVHKDKNQNVLTQMDLIEQRFDHRKDRLIKSNTASGRLSTSLGSVKLTADGRVVRRHHARRIQKDEQPDAQDD